MSDKAEDKTPSAAAAPPVKPPVPPVAAQAEAVPRDPNDRTHPDFEWKGGSHSATQDDVAAAIEHVKAWFNRQLGRA